MEKNSQKQPEIKLEYARGAKFKHWMAHHSWDTLNQNVRNLGTRKSFLKWRKLEGRGKKSFPSTKGNERLFPYIKERKNVFTRENFLFWRRSKVGLIQIRKRTIFPLGFYPPRPKIDVENTIQSTTLNALNVGSKKNVYSTLISYLW